MAAQDGYFLANNLTKTKMYSKLTSGSCLCCFGKPGEEREMKKENGIKYSIWAVSISIIIGCIALFFPQLQQIIVNFAEQDILHRELPNHTKWMKFLSFSAGIGFFCIIILNIFALHIQGNIFTRKISDRILSNKWLNNNYFPLILTSVVYIVFYLLVKGMSGDDKTYFYPASQSMKLFDFLSERYTQWTSRLVIYAVQIVVSRLPFFAWKILTGLCLVTLIWTIYYLFFSKEKPVTIWAYCAFIMLCNFYQLSTSAGWVTTTLNYIWPLSALFLVFIPVKMIEQNKLSNKWQYALFFPFIFFAANLEIYDVVLIFISLLLCIKSIKDKKFEYYYYMVLLASIFMLVFTLTCPGNANRLVAEIETWYPSFGDLSFVQKTALGIMACFNWLVTTNRFVFITSSLLFACIVFLNKKNRFVIRIISLIPFVVSVLVTLLNHAFIIKRITFLQKFFVEDRFGGIVQGDTFHSFNQFLTLAIIICTLIVYAFSIYIIFNNTKQTIMLYLVLLSGFMSNLVLSYSPTIYASRIRTAALLLVSLAIVGTSFFSKCSKEKLGDVSLFRRLTFIVIGIGYMSIIMQIALIIME